MASSGQHTTVEGTGVQVQVELLAMAYRAVPLALLANFLNSTLVAVVLLGEVSSKHLLWWYLALQGVALLRLFGLFSYRGSQLVPESLEAWKGLWFLGTLASGLVWGASAFLIWPAEALYQAFLIMVVVGMGAGSITSLGFVRLGAPLFLLTMLVPYCWRFVSLDSETGSAMALMTVAFFIMVAITGVRTYGVLRAGQETRFAQQRAEATIERQALYDELTDLPNRRLFMDHLNEAVHHAREYGGAGAVLFLDLDNFKRINDSLGHHVGDELLKGIAERLKSRFRGSDTAARLGGDEFVVLLPGLGPNTDGAMRRAEDLASGLRAALAEPVLAGGHELHVTGSIGVAAFPEGTEDASDILKHADAAMYSAKEAGRNGVRAFAASMQESAHQRLEIERDLRYALEQRHFVVHYQPQVDVQGRLVGLEALVRWQKPGHGLVMPGTFSSPKNSGLIFDLHDQVMDLVCEDLSRLEQRPKPHDKLVISVNLSPREFHRPGFIAGLEQRLRNASADPGMLCLEITESAAMQRIEEVIKKMQMLRNLGVHFAIDDFGTGYSSLAYLKRLPVDSLKIDRSFVKDILVDENDAAIVEAILALTSKLGIRTVAEGVETEDIVEFLRKNGCRYFQGWLYGKAEPLTHYFPDLGETGDRAQKVQTVAKTGV